MPLPKQRWGIMETPKGAYRWSRDNPVVIESSKIFDTLEKFSEVLNSEAKRQDFFKCMKKYMALCPSHSDINSDI